jgi:chemotaxis protein MotB
MLYISTRPQIQREDVEEAGYLASASDLMVGLLFIFILMVVILSQRVSDTTPLLTDIEPVIPVLDETLIVTTEPADPTPAEPEPSTSEPAVTSKLDPTPPTPLVPVTTIIGKKLRAGGVNVIIDPTSGVITLPGDALFPLGAADLSNSGKATLTLAKSILNQILPCYIYSERISRSDCPENSENVEIETIFIEGHTDSSPLNRGIYTNWHLGLDRARAIYDVIVPGQMQNFKNERTLEVVGISSYADKRPNKENPTDDSKNRRVELRFVLAYKSNENKSPQETIQIQERIKNLATQK